MKCLKIKYLNNEHWRQRKWKSFEVVFDLELFYFQLIKIHPQSRHLADDSFDGSQIFSQLLNSVHPCLRHHNHKPNFPLNPANPNNPAPSTFAVIKFLLTQANHPVLSTPYKTYAALLL